MPVRDDDDETVRAERIGGQAARIDGAGHDADIADALRDQAHDLVREPLLQIDAHLGVRARNALSASGRNSVRALVFERIRIWPARPPANEPRSSRRRSAWARSSRACCSSVRPAGVGRRPGGCAPEAARRATSPCCGSGCSRRRAPDGRVRPVGDAAGVHHVPEQAQIDEVELHGPFAPILGHGPGPYESSGGCDPSRFAKPAAKNYKLHRRVAYLTLRGWRSVRRVEGRSRVAARPSLVYEPFYMMGGQPALVQER